MNNEIIIAILAFVGVLAGFYFSNNKNTALIQEQVKDLKEDITVLSNRVDKHNNLIEKMTVVEQSCKSNHHRLDNSIWA